MSASLHSKKPAMLLGLALAVCVSAPTTKCMAQAYGAETIVHNNDLRWFEPVELDLDGRIAPQAGFFFRMDKITWAMTGERVEIGDPNVVNLSEEIYKGNPEGLIQLAVNELAIAGVTPEGISEALGVDFLRDGMNNIITQTFQLLDDDGMVVATFDVPQIDPTTEIGPPPPINVQNSIKDAVPEADFSWGERYELGYTDGERGWLVGILDGPEQENFNVYGAGPLSPYDSQSSTGEPGTTPDIGLLPFDIDEDGTLDGFIFNDFFALGFGSVAVNFQAPERYFEGFRDYMINAFPIGTQTGPTWYIGNTGADDDEGLDNEDGEIDVDDIPFIPDDLNGNGDTFGVLLIDTDGDGEGDEVVATFIDFGDLYEFDVFFNDVSVRNRTELDGIELMTTYEVDLSHKLERGRSDYLQIAGGVRYLQMNDMFSWLGTGSILGPTGATIDIDNQIVGPQIMARWIRDRGKWDFFAEGRFTMGYNIIDTGLNGVAAEGSVPGAINRGINIRPTTTVLGSRDDDFSPIAELRLGARYKLSKAMALKVGYTGKFIDNIRRASTSMVYSLPNFALQDGKSDVFINGLDFGVELRY